MSGPIFDLDASVIADWLATEQADRLWGVDGEPQIAAARSLPCPGRELASILRSIGGRVRVFGPEGAPQITSAHEIRKLAHEDDGLMFELAWLSGNEAGEHWLLLNDLLAEELTREALDEQPGATPQNP